jgi:hypothetical protein
MKLLRLAAILLALSLMLGEAYRTWGAGRPIAFWMDDMLVGAMLILSAIAVAKETPATRSFFSASWGVATGMLYVSFFGKVFDPANGNPGNFDLGLLTALVGIAFVMSIAGLILSIRLPMSYTGDASKTGQSV